MRVYALLAGLREFVFIVCLSHERGSVEAEVKKDGGWAGMVVTTHEMGIPLARSWSAIMWARLVLSTAGSAMTENLPTNLERGGSAES
jgi:hypothetical protein